MEEKEMIQVVDTSGNNTMVELVTYLISDDRLKQYIVYTKGEVKSNAGDQIIYISKLFKDSEGYKIQEILDDAEWNEVQHLLKRIANAK